MTPFAEWCHGVKLYSVTPFAEWYHGVKLYSFVPRSVASEGKLNSRGEYSFYKRVLGILYYLLVFIFAQCVDSS